MSGVVVMDEAGIARLIVTHSTKRLIPSSICVGRDCGGHIPIATRFTQIILTRFASPSRRGISPEAHIAQKAMTIPFTAPSGMY